MTTGRHRSASSGLVPRGTVLVAVLLLGSTCGCFDTGRRATEHLRSVLSLDRVPEQYEPPLTDADDVDVAEFE